MLRVSIITIVRNNRATMEDCVKNVLSQSYKEIEYIVVDGGSMTEPSTSSKPTMRESLNGSVSLIKAFMMR